jgi:MoxR-like ATPase
MLLAAKVRALVEGRFAISCEDLREVCRPALRHRLILNFEGEAEGVRPDQILDEVLRSVPEEAR